MNSKGTNVTSNIKDATYIVYSDKQLEGDLRVTIKHQTGNRRRYINGVELLQNNQVVYSTYERKHDNADATGAVYTISNVASGKYTIRIWSSQNTDNEWADNKTRVNITCGSTAIVTNNDIAVNLWTTGDNSSMTEGLKAVCTSVGIGMKDGKFKYKEETVTFTSAGSGVVKYNYTGASGSGNERLDILGFEILNEEGTQVVSSDAHYGYTGSNSWNRDYTYTISAAGNYKVRTWIDGVRNPFSKGTVTYTFTPSSLDGIYEINNQSGSVSRGYFVHSASYPNAPVLAETKLNGYENRDVTDSRHDGSVNPYFGVKTIDGKIYIYSLANGKFLNTSWSDTAVGYTMAVSTRNPNYVTLQNTNISGAQFLCNACGNNAGLENHTIYTGNNDGGNDFVFEAVSEEKATELQTTYAANIAAAEFVLNGGWTVVYNGLTSPAVGGVCYNRANYTGEKIALPYTLDESALIAMHVSGYNGAVSVDDANKTITVTYDQNNTETSVLWPGNGGNTSLPSARIPAIVKAYNGDLLAFSDWRYSRDDIGRNGHLDIEMRRSSDNGVTWSPLQIVANGTGVAGAHDCAYGDAAVVADHEKGDVLLMCAAGSVRSSDSNRSNPTRVARFVSHDNGQTWSGPEDMTDQFYGLITDGNAMFNTSGKLLQSKVIKKDGASHYRIYSPIAVLGSNNRVFYSDDFGVTWHVLGDAVAQNSNDECRVCELPNGDILLETRISGGRRVNLFTYTDQQTATGSWGTVGQNTGTPATACNGDIDVVTAYKAGTNQTVTLVLETAARQGSPRSHVKYYYRALEKTTGFTLSDFTSGWVEGYEVNAGKSAYSSIVYLADEGKEAILFEDAESEDVTGYDSNPWGYDIKFEKHDISLITNNAYFGEDPSVEQTIVAILSDGNGNTFEHEYQGTVGTLPTVPAYCTVATDGTWAKVDDHFTYTAGITMPFVVSNSENVKYYNIYYPIATGGAPCYLYYNSNNASKLCNDHSVTNKSVDDAQVMTASKENTYKYSWAIYGDPFTGFTFKNRQSGTFINIAGASASGTQNANLAAEGSVFTLDYATSGTYNGRWTMQSGTGYIVLWSWVNDVATYNTNANHQGGHFYLVEAPDFEAMTAMLAEKCNGLGTTVGTYAYTGSAEDLTTAQSIVARETTPANAKQLKTLITALTNGRGDLNTPQPGTFLRLKSHKFGTYLNSATVNWNGNSNLLTLVNGKTGDNEKTTIMYLTEDRHLVTYATGMGLCNSIQIKTANSDPYEGNTVLTVSADSKNNVGCYNIKGTYGSTTNYLYGYSDKLARNGSVTDECVWELEEVTALPVTISDAGLATLYSPVALEIPVGVKAYGSTEAADDVIQFEEITGIIPAKTGVIIEGEPNTYDFNITTGGTGSSTLVGTVPTKATEATVYTLQKKGDVLGFYKYSGETLKGFKSYLTLSSSSNGFTIALPGDELTGLNDATQTAQAGEYIDLLGNKVSNPQKGQIYILNGNLIKY